MRPKRNSRWNFYIFFVANPSFKIPKQTLNVLICNDFPPSFQETLRWSNSKQSTAEHLDVFSNTLFNKYSNVASYVISDADSGSILL